ncbi:hypothetical protein TRIHO_41920 [Tritonibacter horizontis]|uniref:Uncharacterized protein n=1 Tax=Tritonibacter horizontis TaxID=1768241 RepID=A0A132BSH4_9RHOB|nr:hypothetical protein TRIHO_41920 [Tritonibacter horizontis]
MGPQATGETAISLVGTGQRLSAPDQVMRAARLLLW